MGEVALTLRGARARAVRVPLSIPLGTSVAVLREVPLLLVDLDTEEGVAGRAYVFPYTMAGARAVAVHVDEAAGMIAGQPIAPQAIHDHLLRRFALIGVSGAVRMALSALDIALWDALGRAAGLPVARLLGGALRGVPAYDSRGLGPMEPGALAEEAARLAAAGCGAVKLRLGYPTLAADLAAVESARSALPEGVGLMVDYNQALTATEAMRRGLALDGLGLEWLEEPVRHDDLRGQAALARALAVPVQAGENFNGPGAMVDALVAGACDLVMPDVARIGGITGFQRAAAVAGAWGVGLSSHLMPEISVHVLAAAQTAHWLEWVDWADAVLAEPLRPVNCRITPPDRPGLGIDWDEDRVRRLLA